MATKLKRGRKPKKEADKVFASGVYLTKSEKRKVEAKHGTLTKALREAVLPECG